DLDEAHELESPLLRFAGSDVEVDAQGLRDLIPGGVDRVERGHRLLEDPRDLIAPDGPHPLGRPADELSAAQHRRPGGPTIARHQTEQRHARLRLARAGLADDREHLTGVDRVIEVFGGRPPFIADPELHSEVVDLEHRRTLDRLRLAACCLLSHHFAPFCSMRSAFYIFLQLGIVFILGSNASRRPSPMQLTHRAMTMMNRPGHQNSHGRVANEVWYSLISWPREMPGGWM